LKSPNKLAIFLIISCTGFHNHLKAQDSLAAKTKDTSWKTVGFFGVNFSQTSLNNWQGGGQNNVAVNSILNAEAVYRKENITWTNKLDVQYGIIRPGEAKLFRKNIDQLFALSKFNYLAFKKYWFYAAQADFRSQLAPGNNYIGDSIAGRATSDFMSPAYSQIAIGLDYKPASYFSAFYAPVAGKITTVRRQHLADAGAYGLQPAVFDDNGNMLKPGRNNRYEFGSRLILKFKKNIIKNVNLDSYLDLFSNYNNNPQNIDVVFNTLITIKISKYFTINFINQTIYDDDIIIQYDWNKDGKFDHPNDVNGPRLQMLTTFAVGFGYKF